MKRMWIRLWNDQRGAVSTVSTLLLYTILSLGAIVGLATLRNHIVQEYGDLAVALDHLDQSWTVQHSWETESRGFEDPGPQLVNSDGESDPVDAEPAGISVQQPPIAEGQPLPGS